MIDRGKSLLPQKNCATPSNDCKLKFRYPDSLNMSLLPEESSQFTLTNGNTLNLNTDNILPFHNYCSGWIVEIFKIVVTALNTESARTTETLEIVETVFTVEVGGAAEAAETLGTNWLRKKTTFHMLKANSREIIVREHSQLKNNSNCSAFLPLRLVAGRGA